MIKEKIIKEGFTNICYKTNKLFQLFLFFFFFLLFPFSTEGNPNFLHDQPTPLEWPSGFVFYKFSNSFSQAEENIIETAMQ